MDWRGFTRAAQLFVFHKMRHGRPLHRPQLLPFQMLDLRSISATSMYVCFRNHRLLKQGLAATVLALFATLA